MTNNQKVRKKNDHELRISFVVLEFKIDLSEVELGINQLPSILILYD